MIQVPDAIVRSGASQTYAQTGTLRQGSTVRIVREEGAWLAIKPPANAVSWIPDRAVQPIGDSKQFPRQLKVISDNAPIRLGVADQHGPSKIEQVKLASGAQVIALNPPEDFPAEGGKWWPIEPPATEVRYILRETVFQSENRNGATPSGPGVSTSARAPMQSLDPNEPELMVRAQLADAAGRFTDAEQLYLEQARLVARTDPNLYRRCINYARASREKMIAARGNSPASSGLSTSYLRGGPTPSVPPATSSTTPPPPPPVNSPSTGYYQSLRVDPGLQASGPGRLRRSGFQLDGRTTYAIENNRGDVLYYAVPQPGRTLEPFVDRIVELFGTVRVRPEVRGASVMIVEQMRVIR
jgi:hypothetical protein